MPAVTRSQKRRLDAKAEEDEARKAFESSMKADSKRPKKNSTSLGGVDDSLPNREIKMELLSDSVTCSVCLLFLKKPVKLDPCHHVFCNSCISKWLIRKRTCPSCRTEPTKLILDLALETILSAFYKCASPSLRESLDCDRTRLTCEMISQEEMTLVEFVAKYKRVFQTVHRRFNESRSAFSIAPRFEARAMRPLSVLFGSDQEQRLNEANENRTIDATNELLRHLHRAFHVPSFRLPRRDADSENRSETRRLTARRPDAPSSAQDVDRVMTLEGFVQLEPLDSRRNTARRREQPSETPTPPSTSRATIVEVGASVPLVSSSSDDSNAASNDIMEIEGVLVAPSDIPDLPTTVILGGVTENESITELITRVMLSTADSWDPTMP